MTSVEQISASDPTADWGTTKCKLYQNCVHETGIKLRIIKNIPAASLTCIELFLLEQALREYKSHLSLGSILNALVLYKN